MIAKETSQRECWIADIQISPGVASGQRSGQPNSRSDFAICLRHMQRQMAEDMPNAQLLTCPLTMAFFAGSLSRGCSPSPSSVWISFVMRAVSGTLLEGKQLDDVRAFRRVDLPAHEEPDMVMPASSNMN